MNGRLVVIRGNSGSGKTTVARLVQSEFDRGSCAVVSQDVVRRGMLRERDIPYGLNIDLIETIAATCLDRGLVTVVEGILEASRYGGMLDRLAARASVAHFLAFDLSLEETERRHATRDADFEVERLAPWYHGWNPLTGVDEVRVGPEVSAEQLAARILSDLGR